MSAPYYLPIADEVQLFTAAWECRLPVLLRGPTGCGKTRFVEYMAETLVPERVGAPRLITVACHEDLTGSDLVGRFLLHGDETVWVDGPLTQAVKHGAVCYLDESQTFLYDEWDHQAADYRRRYCRVHEIALPTDSTALYERTRLAYATVLGQVRHQFERVRPERYRPLRGLEHGEDFDWSALIEARVETRAHRTPNTRVYTARTRQQRDVATLFLVDLSASTEQPYAEPGEPQPHRIIDTLKEALVVMSSALQDLGDSYAIYGFSSHGHDRVEVYPVKAFDEPLGPEVKARIGSMAPKNGTRMGAALRHVFTKFRATQARSKHLILLSDGFPQDQEYGPDRRSYTYGIQDTAVALRELNARGVTPFCITVDRAGNDYLREMCAPEQYMIIEHLEDLPAELPKIYRRVVQS